MSVTMIAAVSLDGVLGVDGRIPWRCPADQRRFRERTMGGAVVMGRRTWESLPPALDLGDRVPIVVSSQNAPRGRALHARDVSQAIRMGNGYAPLIGGTREVWLAGGERIYRDGLEHADRIEVSRIPVMVDQPEGATVARWPWGPTLVPPGWRVVEIEPHEGFELVVIERAAEMM